MLDRSVNLSFIADVSYLFTYKYSEFFLSNEHRCFQQWIELALSSNCNNTFAFYNSSSIAFQAWLDYSIEKEPHDRKAEDSSCARRRMEFAGQLPPAGRLYAPYSTKLSSSLLLTCTDQEQSLGALPGTLQLEPRICKHSKHVYTRACRCMQVQVHADVQRSYGNYSLSSSSFSTQVPLQERLTLCFK